MIVKMKPRSYLAFLCYMNTVDVALGSIRSVVLVSSHISTGGYAWKELPGAGKRVYSAPQCPCKDVALLYCGVSFLLLIKVVSVSFSRWSIL